MKFELDTTAKTVKLLSNATLGEVNEVLKKILGKDADQFCIITTVVNYNPVVIGQKYWWPNATPITVPCLTITGNALLCETTTGNTLIVSELANN